jgi:hypothetical protein
MRLFFVHCLAWASCMLGIVVEAAAFTPVSYRVNFKSQGVDVPVQYRAWIPEGVDRIKGLIVTLPGSRGDQQGITGNSAWQFRLSHMGYGIIGFRDVATGAGYWGADSAEVHANLKTVLDSVAASFNHPEISNAPVLLDGVSQGGFNVGHLASFIPERTLGFIADKGYFTGTFDNQAYSAPGVVIAGQFDQTVPATSLYQQFQFGRQFDMNLGFINEWRIPHSETTENLRLVLMDQMIRERYPHGQLPSLLPNQPLDLREPTGWLAEAPRFDQGQLIYNPSPIIAPKASYPLDHQLASWFLNETTTTIFRARNDDTFARSPIVMSSIPYIGQIQLSLAVEGIVSNHLELYHNNQLIGQFDPSTGPIEFWYTPKQNGLHTFIAKASYESNGETKFTTNYLAAVARGVVAVPEPSAMILLTVVGVVVFSSRSLSRN